MLGCFVSQAGCSESQVREYFTKLRSNVRSFMQRLQRKATAAEAPSAGADIRTAPPAARPLTPPSGSAGSALGGHLSSQPAHPQSAAAQPAHTAPAAASDAPSSGVQPPQTPAAFSHSRAAAPARPMSASQTQASPMTATDLRTLLANVASAQVALQQSSASAGSASLTVRTALI